MWENENEVPRMETGDAAHEKVPNRRNGAISMVAQRTYQGIKQNKNHSKIPSSLLPEI